MKPRVPPASQLAPYGLTPEDYVRLWEAQCGRCCLCEKSFSRSRFACVDHDHRTGEVRGLACTACNYLIGSLHENLQWFINAVLHLTHPIASRVFKRPRIHIDAPPQEDTP